MAEGDEGDLTDKGGGGISASHMAVDGVEAGGKGGIGENESGSSGESADGAGIANTNGSKDMEFTPRIRQYGNETGPFIVYLRALKKFSLDVVKVSNDLFKKYKSIKTIDPVNRDKLRIEFGVKDEANKLPTDKDFNVKFAIYVPARSVEIDGKVVLNDFISTVDILKGVGLSNGSTEEIKVLEVERLKKKITDEKGNAKYLNTPFVRVAFEGRKLPDVLLIGKLRLPVNVFTPKIMRCGTCLMVGHTDKFCANRKRCDKCGQRHETEAEFESCAANSFWCPNCSQFYRERIHDCPKVSLIRQTEVEKALASRGEGIQAGGESANAWQMKEMSSRKKLQGKRSQDYKNEYPLANAVVHKNKYGVLAVTRDGDDCTDSDENMDSDEESELETAIELSEDADMSEATEGGVKSKKRSVGTKRKRSGNTQRSDDITEQSWFDWAAEADKKRQQTATKVSPANASSPRVLAGKEQRVKTKKQESAREAQQVEDKEPSGVDEEGYEGFKDMVLSFLGEFGLGSGILKFIEKCVLPLVYPWIRKCLNVFLPKLFTMFAHHG